MIPQTQELMVDLDSIYHAIEYGGNEEEIKSKTLSVFANWSQGTYGSGSDTDVFILCPRTTDGTAVLKGNHKRLMDFLAKLGESTGVMVFKATLEYSREGMPIHLEAYNLPWVINPPLGERPLYLFDKDTMYKQQWMLKDICAPRGRLVCTVSPTNKRAVIPSDAFTSRPPDFTLFGPGFLGHRDVIIDVYTLQAVVLIPKDRISRALKSRKQMMDATSSFRTMGSSASDGPEWGPSVCLKNFPAEVDCVHLLENLDLSVAQERPGVWNEVMGILCRFKTAKEIGTSRIFASIRKFSFKKVRPFLDILVTRFDTVNDIFSFTAGIKEASQLQDQDVVRQWCADRGDNQIMRILGSDEKTLPSLVQYAFVKGLPLLSNFIKSLSKDKTVGFTFWLSLVSHLDRQWQSVNSLSFAGAPLHELYSMLDCCIAAMTPLVTEGAIYTLVPPGLMDDVRHNAEVHVKRAVILIEICLRFSPGRCGEVLSDVLLVPGDLQTKFDLLLRPFVRSLRPLLNQYGVTIFRPPFSLFYRFLIGMFLGNLARSGKPPLARTLCTKKVVCDRCEFIENFLSSGEESKELIVTNKEWKHVRYVFPKLKDRIFPPTVTSGHSWKTIRITRRPEARTEAAREFLLMIGDEGDILKLVGPLKKAVWETLKNMEPFDIEPFLQFPPPTTVGSQTA